MKKELEVILNSTHDAMIAVNKEGVITLFNKAAEKLTHIDADYALGKHIKRVILNTRLMHILNTGDLELNREQDLGSIRIVTNRMPVKNEDGEIIGAVAVFRDISDIIDLATEITNLKEVQSMLEAIFHSTQDAITVVDQNGINVLINPAYTRLTGLGKKEVIGKIATADIAEGESIHLKVIETKKPVKNARVKVGPMKKEVIATASPILVDEEIRGSVAILRDVSDVLKLNEDLKLAKQIIRNLEAKYTFEDIEGINEKLKSCIKKAKAAAEVPATVLLRGESGTGKELFAHAIHNASKRKYNQFIRVNCAALSESLLESELFGYDEGAFTGAKKGGKKGLFEEANGGTIFLDEIGDISLNTQVKLLRVLQEKEVVRVGGINPININVRIIAATNMDLEKAISDGKYREDLYYRLNVVPINIPPLRNRKDDIYDLTLKFIKKFNQEYGRNNEDISYEAIQLLKKHDWPGNIRELENVIGRAIINMKINEIIILPRHIPKDISSTIDEDDNSACIKDEALNSKPIPLQEFIDDIEKRYLQKILKDNNFNKTATSKILGISVRNLYYKIEKYNLS